MTLEEALAKLESLGDEKVRKSNRKHGAGENQYGVKHGDIRRVAATIESDHDLALALWKTGNVDAQLLAVLVLEPKKLSRDEVDRMVRSIASEHVAEWLVSYAVKKHPDKEALRQAWMTDGDRWAARAGWALTSERVGKSPEGPDPIDLVALLDRVEREMRSAPPETQWTMNACLATIGIHFPELRRRALAIGEKLGVYRDYPVSKGCTSPFAPIWIREMVARRGKAGGKT